MAHHASLSVMLRIKSGTAGKGERISASRQRALKFQTILIDFPPPTFAIKSAYTSRRKEGRKEGFRPVSTKIPRPCTGYPAEWIPGGIAWEVFVREKENVGIVEFGLKIIALYTKFGWINKGGLLGEREDSIYFRLPVPSRNGMIYAERVPRLHAAGEFSLSALHPAVSPGWQSVALPSLSLGPPSTSPSALRCIFLG